MLFRGAYGSTMLRRDAYHFTRLGSYLERADNTARILDVKYHVLLPTEEGVGGGLDYYQWTAILRAVVGHRAPTTAVSTGTGSSPGRWPS